MVRFGIFSRLDLLNGYLVKNRETDDATIREYFTDTSDTLDETTEIDPEIRAGVEAAWSLYQDARQQMESQQQSVSAYTDDIANAILAMSEVIQGCISGDGTVNTMRLNEQMAVFAPFEADASLQNTQIGRRIHLLKGSLDAILQDSSVAFINATVRYTFA